MGKGGESIITSKDKCSAWALSKKAKLEKLNTEELRKWAKNYSVVCSDEREVLLNELVSTSFDNDFSLSLSHKFLSRFLMPMELLIKIVQFPISH